MHNDNGYQTTGKGRPSAPFKIERLAIATYLANQGMTFGAAASAGVIFYRYDFALKQYVRDEDTHARLPQTPEGRRTALHKIKRGLLGRAERELCHGWIPVAYRLVSLLKRGRPKKIKLA